MSNRYDHIPSPAKVARKHQRMHSVKRVKALIRDIQDTMEEDILTFIQLANALKWEEGDE